MQRKIPAESSDPSLFVIPVTGDKGLCGAVNSSIVRNIKKLVAEHPNRSKIKLFSVEEKGSSGLKRPMPDLLKMSISKIGVPVNYPTVMAMAVHIANDSQDSDKIIVAYNEY